MSQLFFIQLTSSDIIDILLVAFLIYTIYKLVKGTVAINIFLGLVSIYFIWKLVGMFKMRMLDEILGQFISVGVIALIIVFQQEIRSFLLMLGKLSADRSGSIRFLKKIHQPQQIEINTLTNALQNMSKTLTGALIVIRRNNELKDIIDTGERIDGILTAPLVESIFYKNNPLHDGAIIISHNKIEAARCVLPVSERTDFPPEFGLRHRAAAGLSQNTDALCIVVSEQTGEYAYSDKGELFTKIPLEEIHNILTQEFQRADNTK